MKLSEKIRIVLAEDETVLRSALKEQIEQMDSEFLVTDLAANGREALAAIQARQPHVLITDIRMPEMDGLTLIEQVRRSYPAIKTVILSGYSDFSYMQQAIRSGVSEYLLKPVEETALAELLQNLKEAVLVSQYHQDRSLIYSTNYKLEEANSRKKLLYLICVGNLCANINDFALQQQLRERADRIDWNSLCKQVFPADTWWFLEDEQESNQKVLCCHLCPGVQPDGEAVAQQLLQRLQKQLPECPVTVCGTMQQIEKGDFWMCVQRLRRILRQKLVFCRSSVLFLERDEMGDENSEIDILQMRINDQLREAITQNNLEAIHAELGEILSFLLESDLTQHTVQKMCLCILNMIEYAKRQELSSVQTSLLRILTLFGTGKTDQLQAELMNLLMSPMEGQKEELSEQLLQYVNQHYLQLSNMEKLTETFHYSYAHLSRLFKKETGDTLNHYVQRKRIRLAKQLIENNEAMSLTQVGQMSGFGDKRHFQRVFKEFTGVTPSEFRKNVLLKG